MPDRPIVIPQLNANEDRVKVVAIHVSPGKHVAEAAPLATVETTKATVDVPAPCSGTITKILAAEGQEMKVGAVLCYILNDSPEIAPEGPKEVETKVTPLSGEIHITAKARLRAVELGVNIVQVVPIDGRVGVAEVEAFARTPQQTGIGEHAAPGVQAPLGSRDLLQPTAPGRRRAVIVGGGRHAACVIDAVGSSDYELIGCVDSEKPAGHLVQGEIKVIGKVEMLASLLQQGIDTAFIGVGGATDNRPRSLLFSQVSKLGFLLPPVIHPSAYVARGVTIGPGSTILANASIGAETKVGANVIINQGANVCHHCVIEDHAHIAPGGILAGGCRIGSGSTLGMGATVFMDVQIGRWCLIYNGVSVVANVPDNSVIKQP